LGCMQHVHALDQGLRQSCSCVVSAAKDLNNASLMYL